MVYLLITILGSIASTFCFTYFFNLVHGAVDFWIPLLIFIGSWFVMELFCYLLFAFITGIFIRKPKTPFPEKYSKFCDFIMKQSAWFFMFSTGYFYKIVGKEKIPHDRRYLIVSNHRDGNDPIIYIAGMPQERVGWICKKEVIDMPCVGKLLLNLCSLPLERDNLRQEVKVIKKAQDYINDDICSVGIYPEGTRNKTENMLLPFKAGAFKIATATKCPVVVSCITYNYPRVHKSKPLIKIATINILRVIEPEEFEGKDTNELAEMVRSEILEFLDKENA